MKEFTLPIVKPLHWIWYVLSIILFPLTFLFFYCFVYERELIYNRIAIYKFLKENGVPEPKEKILDYTIFDLGEIEITDSGKTWYAFRKNSFDCINCSFSGDLVSLFYYKEIHKMLKEAQK